MIHAHLTQRFHFELPEPWEDRTVYDFADHTAGAKILVHTEHHDVAASLEDHLQQRTHVIREAAVDGAVLDAGPYEVGEYPAVFVLLEFLRGDRTPLRSECVIIQYEPLDLLVLTVEAPLGSWDRARAAFEGLLGTLRRDA